MFFFSGSIDVPKFQSVKLTKCSNKKFFPRAFTVQLFIDFATKFVFGRTDTRTLHVMLFIRHTPRVHNIIIRAHIYTFFFFFFLMFLYCLVKKVPSTLYRNVFQDQMIQCTTFYFPCIYILWTFRVFWAYFSKNLKIC